MSKVYVLARVAAKNGREKELEKELRAVVEPVRREPGCERYDLHRGESGYEFFFYEIWSDRKALEAHGNTPHIEAMRRRTEEMTMGPVDVFVCDAVDVQD